MKKKNGLIVDEYRTKRWYKDGKLNREDGPAIEYDGYKEWYLDGKEYTEEEYNIKIQLIKENNKMNFTADDARALAQKYEKPEPIDYILKKIKTAARQGKTSVCIEGHQEWSVACSLKKRLKENGFKVSLYKERSLGHSPHLFNSRRMDIEW
jgi:hypothetical protein